ncbi:MAG: type IV secretory system conjugative DNA transfer family protein [Asticcacaulis sp.]
MDSTSQSGGNHWTAGARELVLALCLFAKVYYHKPTLVTVFELLGGSHGTVLGSMREPSQVFAQLLASDALNGTLRAMAVRWLEIPDREQGSILSTARRQLSWLEGLNQPDAAMTRVCQASDFSLPDLKRKDVTVFLCLPASYMNAYRPWLRAFVNLAMSALENTPSRPGTPPVLLMLMLMLDEFTSLGKMASLERAAGLLAGSGVKLWLIIQDVSRLHKIYGDSWGTFVGNAGVTTWFALGGDTMTADYLSNRLGTTQYYERETPGGDFRNRAAIGLLTGGGRWVTDKLLHPHELERAFARGKRSPAGARARLAADTAATQQYTSGVSKGVDR